MAVDKYITICWKSCQLFDREQKNRLIRSKILIFMVWIIGIIIASMPLLDAFNFASNTKKNFQGYCYFTKVSFYLKKIF